MINIYIIENIKNTILQGDVLEQLRLIPNESIDMCITSPPYWNLRDYKQEKQIGQEKDYKDYINKLIEIYNEVRRVLKKNGTCWVNIDDTYSKNNKFGVKKQSLIGIPERFKIAMIDNGWICRNEIIWHKPNAMPCSVKTRFNNDYEKLFFFTRENSYYFEQQKEQSKDTYNGKRGSSRTRKKLQSAMRDVSNEVKIYKERNKRTVWSINTKPFKGSHFAVYPEELIETPIKAGCPENGIVLDIFMGSGTTGVVSKKLGRNYIGIELNPEYVNIANKRIANLEVS